MAALRFLPASLGRASAAAAAAAAEEADVFPVISMSATFLVERLRLRLVPSAAGTVSRSMLVVGSGSVCGIANEIEVPLSRSKSESFRELDRIPSDNQILGCEIAW